MLINEIAKMAGLSKDGIRHYEELGLITSTPRQASSRTYREYNLSVLKTIENIRDLQRLGLSLSEIGPILKVTAAGYTQEQLIQFLEEGREVIRGKIAKLSEIEVYITRKLKGYQAKGKPSNDRKPVKKTSAEGRSRKANRDV
ncbi:MerR family transcriptional regulator [Acidicapsa ligni]|uniref:MerR family transcriptional regulator n=1 Tax=Acidicapsa ligni TaxID=542300 RepID=UPI0021E07311|nr:MerR family transcriptional regulator [Acidicapsa ligni]